MEVSEFKQKLDELTATSSRNEKKDIIREVSDSPAAISFLSGSEFQDAGLGKKTVLSVAQDVFGDDIDGTPTVSENLDRETTATSQEGRSMEQVRKDMRRLADESGNSQKEMLAALFEGYSYPSVLSHACLDDWPTGCSEKTIASALDIRESLPFHESVVEIVKSDEPLTEPEVGKAFSPQLAKSESSLPEWQE